MLYFKTLPEDSFACMFLNVIGDGFVPLYSNPFFHHQDLYCRALYTIYWTHTGWRQIQDLDRYMPLHYRDEANQTGITIMLDTDDVWWNDLEPWLLESIPRASGARGQPWRRAWRS